MLNVKYLAGIILIVIGIFSYVLLTTSFTCPSSTRVPGEVRIYPVVEAPMNSENNVSLDHYVERLHHYRDLVMAHDEIVISMENTIISQAEKLETVRKYVFIVFIILLIAQVTVVYDVLTSPEIKRFLHPLTCMHCFKKLWQ